MSLGIRQCLAYPVHSCAHSLDSALSIITRQSKSGVWARRDALEKYSGRGDIFLARESGASASWQEKTRLGSSPEARREAFCSSLGLANREWGGRCVVLPVNHGVEPGDVVGGLRFFVSTVWPGTKITTTLLQPECTGWNSNCTF